MGIIRGKVNHPKWWDIVKGPPRIVVGESPWTYCEEHNKYFDKKTGEEVEVIKMSLVDFLDLNNSCLCCKKENK